MCISIPPKYSVSNVVGYIKGKSATGWPRAIGIARHFLGKSLNFSGENFWARGYFVSTVGLMKRWLERISESKKRQTNGMSNSHSACRIAAFRRLQHCAPSRA